MSNRNALAGHAPLHPCFVVAHMNLTGGTAMQARKAIAEIYRRDHGREPPLPKPLAPAELPMVEALMLTLSTRQRAGLLRLYRRLDHAEPDHRCSACGSDIVTVSADPAPGLVSWCDTCEPRCEYDPRHRLAADPVECAAHYRTCKWALLEHTQHPDFDLPEDG